MTESTDHSHLSTRYDDDRRRFSVPPDDVIAKLVQSPSVARVLDLGCGTGAWIAAQRDMFRGSVAMLLGADLSEAMLAGALAKEVSAVVCARAEDLPLRDAAADYIVSSFSFHHFTDKERALDEVSRILDPERGVFRINNIEPERSMNWWVYEFFPEAIALDAARFWSAARIATALDERGFVVGIDLGADPPQIPAREALADAERRVISELAELDDETYSRGVDRLRQAAGSRGTTVTMASTFQLTARRR